MDGEFECHYSRGVSLYMDATMTGTKTAPTKEEAAAIRRWAEAIRAAEETLYGARPSSVRSDVLDGLGIGDAGHSVIGQIRQERRAAQIAAEKLPRSEDEKVDALVRWIAGDLRGPAPSID